jgi:hypothetical protein
MAEAIANSEWKSPPTGYEIPAAACPRKHFSLVQADHFQGCPKAHHSSRWFRKSCSALVLFKAARGTFMNQQLGIVKLVNIQPALADVDSSACPHVLDRISTSRMMESIST